MNPQITTDLGIFSVKNPPAPAYICMEISCKQGKKVLL